ncbi:hypothetical protein E2562_020529 [Oryza meyeriana var. granulata]|uniref:Uncharacterized protein n=1 Tax=Oryza meyeriana var. granulata TaxID=110450 RepID=A0A6G1EAW7_9ORYZ|nr:hypothetical protein E2562_020529 [Oryza meyeriana var. granulata]
MSEESSPFRSSLGKDGHYFDLVDFSRIKGFNVPDCMTIGHFKSPDRFNFSQWKLTEKFGTPVQCQRLWLKQTMNTRFTNNHNFCGVD